MRTQVVVVLGASAKAHRYSNMAIRSLVQHGHRVIPVHPRLQEVEALPVVASLSDVQEPVDTLTLYVGPQRVEPLIDEIVALAPKRVILNPGTESEHLIRRLQAAHIDYLEACTLVMLNTDQFDID